jgi:non-ribosomal peptide synthetase component F
MTEHRNVVGLFFNDGDCLVFGAHDTLVSFHSYCFDMGLWEIYGALLYGGKLIIIKPETVTDLNQYHNVLDKEAVTIVTQTPQFMYNLIDMEKIHHAMDSIVRYVYLGGEALKPSAAREMKNDYRLSYFYNLYRAD